MSLFQKEPLERQQVLKEVETYNQEEKKRIWAYLGWGIWLIDSIWGLFIKQSLGHFAMLLAWILFLVLFVIREFRKKKTYLRNLAILRELERDEGNEKSGEG